MENKLRVWWIPQIPMKPFTQAVTNLAEAKLLLDTLALYDEFQYNNRIKPDYSNMGGLQEYDEVEKEWLDWMDSDGYDFETYMENLSEVS